MNNSSDEDIWKSYAKGVKRLGAHEEEPKPEKPAKRPREKEQKEKETPTVIVEPPPQPIEPLDRAILDGRVERNIKSGDVIIEARLDLHGKTFQEAHETLSGFIQTQAKRGRRMLLVITGRGRSNEASLRTDVPRWCAEMPLRAHILAVRPAAPNHGGEGAWYVVLKRQRI